MCTCNRYKPFADFNCHQNLPEANRLDAIYRAQRRYPLLFEPYAGSFDICPAAGELHGKLHYTACRADSVCPIPAPASTSPYLDASPNLSTGPLTNPDILVLSAIDNSESAADYLTHRGVDPAAAPCFSNTCDQPASATPSGDSQPGKHAANPSSDRDRRTCAASYPGGLYSSPNWDRLAVEQAHLNMAQIKKTILTLLFIVIIAGCVFPAVSPSSDSPANPAQITLVLEMPGSPPTPTPFQPFSPTPTGMAVAAPLSTESGLPQATATPGSGVPPTQLPEQPAIDQPFGQVNVLLLGADARPRSKNFRTDTIILVTMNSDLGNVNVTSFPRDMWVSIPDYGPGRINTAWYFGGYQMLDKTFKHNFGVNPDYYALIDFSSFKHIVDSLGGLNVKVTQPLSDYRAGYWVTIPKGEVHMDADTVLWYVRSRKSSNDFHRNRRQQEVLLALFQKFLTLDAIRRAPEFYDIFKESVTTDIGLIEILTWLPLVAHVAETGSIKNYYIGPGQVYDWITPDGAMVLVPNQGAVMQIINKSQNAR